MKGSFIEYYLRGTLFSLFPMKIDLRQYKVIIIQYLKVEVNGKYLFISVFYYVEGLFCAKLMMFRYYSCPDLLNIFTARANLSLKMPLFCKYDLSINSEMHYIRIY